MERRWEGTDKGREEWEGGGTEMGRGGEGERGVPRREECREGGTEEGERWLEGCGDRL